jgi:processive 1,2-diacylglycerol beta-glucosyltransferase
VLLLTSGLGCGHVRALDALAAALAKRAPEATVRRLDFWSLMNPGIAASVQQMYLELVQGSPDLYDRLHRLDQRTWRRILENDVEPPPEVRELVERILANGIGGDLLGSALGPYPTDLVFYPTACATLPSTERRGLGSFALPRLAMLKWAWTRLQGRLERQIDAFDPDVVVSTQMVPAALLSAVKLDRGLALPSVGVLTDFGVHDYWVQPGTDLYCVPEASMIDAPFDSARTGSVVATGIPLMPGFARPPSPAESRAMLGLDPGCPVVLVLGGGLGLGVDGIAARLLDALPGVQVVAMTGQNAAARAAMARPATRHDPRLVVCDWTERMEAYLSAADLVVGKAGGLTVGEALACGRPLVVAKSLRGQEGFNVDFLERHDVGRLVDEAALTGQVAAWLSDPDALARRQARALELGRRDGADRVARLALDFAAGRTTLTTGWGEW